MIDYKLIADNDPTGPLATAFATMASQTVASTPETMLTYINIANQVGFVEATLLEVAVLANATLPKWVNNSLNAGGVNVNDPQVAGLLTSMVSTSFTQAMVDAIIATGVVTTAKYAGLKEGHLQNAREMRLAGTI